jgi:hypothetical protein
MVVAEVREPDDVEDDAVDTVPAEGLRAHLQGHGADPALPHPGQQRVDLAGLGGGEAADHLQVADVPLRGGAEAGDEPELPEDPGEQVRGGRLAVGAGDAEDLGRVLLLLLGAIHPAGDRAERLARGVDDEDRQAGVLRQFRTGRVGEHRNGAAILRPVHELGAVPAGARHGHIQVTRLDLFGVDRDPGQVDPADGADVLEPELGDELGEGSC